MEWCLLAAVLLAAPGLGEAAVTTDLSPRVAGVADAATWRDLQINGPVYGSGPKSYFVRTSDLEGLNILRHHQTRSAVDQWVPVELDPAQLHRFIHSGRFQVRASPAHRPSLELSRRDIRADRVLLGHVGESSRSGVGVVVGVIDTGVDLLHPAFTDATGRSRIIAVWDQDSSDGRPPEGFGYGATCGTRMIRDGECPLSDHEGHGTHVAGIAAGNRDLGGVAPDAEIVVVASDTFTRIADAVRYIVEVAEGRGMPAVINLSVGGHYGPHNGKTPLELFLDGYLGKGRVLIGAAGNDGNDRLHIEIDLDEDDERRMALENLPLGKPTETLVEFWSSRGTRVKGRLEFWVGRDVVASIDLSAGEKEHLESRVELSDVCVIRSGYDALWQPSHQLRQRVLIIDATQCEDGPDDLTVAFAVTGVGKMHGWVGQSDYRHGVARFAPSLGPGWVGGDERYSITVPSTGASVITVGAYAVRNEWTAESGDSQVLSLVAGQLAPYSSRGPSINRPRTGLKPLLSAPGSVVVSARSHWVPTSTATLDIDRVVMQGTSMAAPHVAGVVALMLEARDNLSAHDVSDILVRTARLDEFTGPSPSAAWGYGKIDAEAAVFEAERFDGGCSQAGNSSVVALLLAFGSLVLARRRRPCIKGA